MGSIENWNEILQQPAFWRLYYGYQIAVDEGENPDDILRSIFGVGDRTENPLHDQLFGLDVDPHGDRCDEVDAPIWNVLTLPFADGFSWHIRFAATPGIYHYLSHADVPEKVCLGYDSTNFMLPILRWPEVLHMIGGLHNYWQWVQPPIDEQYLVPLLAPITWLTENDDAEDIRTRFREAWNALDILDSRHLDLLVERFLLPVDVRWEQSETYGWVTNSEFSFRNPESAVRQTPAAEFFAFFQGFLNMLERQTGVASEDGSVEGRAE